MCFWLLVLSKSNNDLSPQALCMRWTVCFHRLPNRPQRVLLLQFGHTQGYHLTACCVRWNTISIYCGSSIVSYPSTVDIVVPAACSAWVIPGGFWWTSPARSTPGPTSSSFYRFGASPWLVTTDYCWVLRQCLLLGLLLCLGLFMPHHRLLCQLLGELHCHVLKATVTTSRKKLYACGSL